MSQSKLSITDTGKKKFVIKRVFKNIGNGVTQSMRESQFGILWTLDLCWHYASDEFTLTLKATKQNEPMNNWSIDAKINFSTFKTRTSTHTFSENSKRAEVLRISFNEYRTLPKIDNLVDLPVECQIEIKSMTGIEKKKLRHFDKESAETFSDVVLIVGGEKFYVLKRFLASHSTYFESLLLGNFSESEKSEIELKDIDPEHFQNFLELINGESLVDDSTVEGVLNLADFFDSKTAIRRCEEFLLNRSKLPLKVKFDAANKCQLDELKKKCISEMKTKEDVESVLPDDPYQINQAVWQELFKKAISFK